jgi:hypothetical protein
MEAFRKRNIQLDTLKQQLEDQSRQQHLHYASVIKDKDKSIKVVTESF